MLKDFFAIDNDSPIPRRINASLEAITGVPALHIAEVLSMALESGWRLASDGATMAAGKDTHLAIIKAPVQSIKITRNQIINYLRSKAATGLPLFSKRSEGDLEAEQDRQDAAPRTPKTQPYAGKKVSIQVKIEDTNEIAELIMNVSQTLDDYAEQTENIKYLLECLA